MSKDAALDFIHQLKKFGSVLGLENISRLLSYLGNPENDIKAVHIAGTNGKGSTATMLSCILSDAGYKTGLYISPYIDHFNERIQINNQPINDLDLVKYTEHVRTACNFLEKQGYPHPTEFEVVTAIGLLYFKEQQVDVLVLETGLGGRLDATNVFEKPLLTIITSIGYDHTNVLGAVISTIASEKAGIIKNNVPVILALQKYEEASDVISKRARELFSPIYYCNSHYITVLDYSIDNGLHFAYNNPNSTLQGNYHLMLRGHYQQDNVLTVLMALDYLISSGYKIEKKHISNVLRTMSFPGRFEVIHQNPYIIVDGGHNIDGIISFVRSFSHSFPDRKATGMLSVLKDKDIGPAILALEAVCDHIITLPSAVSKGHSAKELAEHLGQYTDIDISVCNNINDLPEFIDWENQEKLYFYVGSLYTIGQVKSALTLK